MSQPANVVRFTENATGAEVLVETTFVWGDEDARQSFVTLPSGRKYALTAAQLNRHFTIVTPQEVFITAFGIDDRPLPAQARLDAETAG